MKLNFRSFTGKSLRPSPVVKDSPSTVAVVTPWNASQSSAENVIRSFSTLYDQLSQDKDSTQPFQKMVSLSTNENNLRVTCMQINNNVFYQFNQNEIQLGFEIFFAVKTPTEFSFVQVGNPQVYLARKNFPLQLIGQNASLFTDYSNSSFSAPLPHSLLGLFPDLQIHIRSIRLQPEDQIVLLSRTFVPPEFLNCKEISLESLAETLSQDQSSESFWLGQLTF
ncbi:MAG: hypothetical protein OXK80_06535 [Bdellovibrionales bacterium]|nr:hypothetical protein [Bdellovibrionales bacterium]